MWKLWLVATAYSQRPSQVMGIQSDYAAYCFDSAVRSYGVWVENKLSERSNLGYPKHDLENLLQGKEGRSLDPSQFASTSKLMEWAEM